MFNIRRLTANDYDKLYEMLNFVFGNKYGRKMDFLLEQPRMWVRDDEHMGKHIGIFDGDILASVVGIYPLEVIIDGESFMFYTIGNMATRPEYEGNGFFTKLYALAMEELKRLNADGARLGGARQRYARYGFEMSGALYRFNINDHTSKHCEINKKNDITFDKIERENYEYLSYTYELMKKKCFYVERSIADEYRDVYRSLCTKESVPYIAIKNGEPIGYLAAANGGTFIFEIKAESPALFTEIAIAWQKVVGGDISVPVAPFMRDELRELYSIAADFKLYSPSRFKIIKFDRLANALIKLKAKYTDLGEFEYVIDIKDYGRIIIYSDKSGAGCKKTEREPDVSLSALEATRFLFGPLNASEVADIPAGLAAALPLPLTWNSLDYC